VQFYLQQSCAPIIKRRRFFSRTAVALTIEYFQARGIFKARPHATTSKNLRRFIHSFGRNQEARAVCAAADVVPSWKIRASKTGGLRAKTV
jgi:hypothetical protein